MNHARAPEGRLELTWTNKDLRLLAHEDGSYEWVPPSEYRVAEVRLLDNAATVGAARADRSRAKDNLLVRGDAFNALTSLVELREFAGEYEGKVKLAYLDPPFNTGQAFPQYDDALEHSVWLTMMRDRLVQVRKLLAANGSVWVHLDDAEMAYCKALLDEVFGRDNFVSVVIWEKSDSPRMDAHNFSGRHDYILVYSKSPAFRVNRIGQGEIAAHYNKTDENGEAYYLKPLRAMGGQGSTRTARPTLYFPIEAPDGTLVYPRLPDGGDGAWRWQRDKVQRDKHLIEWVRTERGWSAYFRIYDKGRAVHPRPSGRTPRSAPTGPRSARSRLCSRTRRHSTRLDPSDYSPASSSSGRTRGTSSSTASWARERRPRLRTSSDGAGSALSARPRTLSSTSSRV